MIRKMVFNLLGVIAFSVFFFLAVKCWVSSYLIKQKPIQELCGKLTNEYTKSYGKTSTWYWVIGNNEKSITIIRPFAYKDQYKIGDKLCVQYAVDFDLQDYPYVFVIWKTSEQVAQMHISD